MLGQRIKSPEMITLPGTPEVELLVRPSTRARRLSLRISRLDGRVTMSVPKGTPRREAVKFAQERADWIRGHLKDIPTDVRPGFGDHVPFLGKPHQLVPAETRLVRLGDGVITLPSKAPDKIGPRLMALFKNEARQRLDLASRRYAAEIGYEFNRITLRDTRSRWGSCSSDGNLMYSWRLVMAPEEVLDYVAAHEVSHLAHMDHSARFWGQVEEICPDYQIHRKWLQKHGTDLHRYRFRD